VLGVIVNIITEQWVPKSATTPYSCNNADNCAWVHDFTAACSAGNIFSSSQV